MTANQQYTVTQGRADTRRLQGYIDNLGVFQNGSGDLAIGKDGWQHPIYTPSSLGVVAQRKSEIKLMYALVIDSSSNVSQLVKNVLIKYNTTDFGYLEYIDNPYANRTGEFSSTTPIDQIFYGVHRTSVTGTSPNGRGIQYSALMWEPKYGGGFMSEQFITTFLHEPLHRGLRQSNHPASFYQRVNEEVLNFYLSYPQYVPTSWEGNF